MIIIIAIKDLRNINRMSQTEFAEYFGIPVGTIRNWEQGISSPPDYVITMIINIMRRDKMINIETIKFTKMLDYLSKLEKNGIEKFEKANQKNYGTKIFYDEKSEDENGRFKVVMDACIIDNPDCIHHDIISYFDDETNEFQVRIAFDEDEEEQNPYLIVILNNSEEQICFNKNRWYFVL